MYPTLGFFLHWVRGGCIPRSDRYLTTLSGTLDARFSLTPLSCEALGDTTGPLWGARPAVRQGCGVGCGWVGIWVRQLAMSCMIGFVCCLRYRTCLVPVMTPFVMTSLDFPLVNTPQVWHLWLVWSLSWLPFCHDIVLTLPLVKTRQIRNFSVSNLG